MPWARAKRLFLDGRLDPPLLGEPISYKGLPARVSDGCNQYSGYIFA